jgi:hypothetical protein
MPIAIQKNQATKELEKMLKDVGNFDTTEEELMQFIENNQIELEDQPTELLMQMAEKLKSRRADRYPEIILTEREPIDLGANAIPNLV